MNRKRSSFSGKLGFVLSAAGASVGLGNIWRFPYLAAKYGGGIFLLVYIILALTFGYTMIVAETALGRMTKKSPVGAYESFGKSKWLSFGGWINAVIPILIVPYYSVIGGWVIKYLAEYLLGHGQALATDEYFSAFISNGFSTEICFILFTLFTVVIIYAGVRNGIERVSKFMMPILVVLSLLIAGYSVSRPGAMSGVKYLLVPNLENFSWMTVVSAMGQMFYSLSIAMGILITFGSYMKKDTSIEDSTQNVEIFDTAIAIMAGLMIIPAVFAFSSGDPDTLQAGPALMFITIPKVFASMGLGAAVGILFFVLVLFAAITSSIALTESAVSTFEDELHWSRKKATVFMAVIMLLLGTLSCLGYGPLAGVTVIGMQFLDFFDFLTNSVMMPIAAIATCLLVSRVIGVAKIEQEVTNGGHPFRRKVIFQFMIQYLCPIFAAIILISSVANAFGWISM
ncbi:sodium-dependent transporter [Clostridium sp. AM30-24]|nr:sodium-dependent transporter [Clostridium sp. AM30-24]RHT38876.1 sodium-dependent transporter [Clostridium sp. AM30-24]